MKNLKRLLMVLLSFIFVFSCMVGEADVEFKDYDKGVLTLKLKVGTKYKEDLKPLLVQFDSNFENLKVSDGKNESLGEYEEYQKKIPFNSVEELQSGFETIDKSFFEGSKIEITKMDDNKVSVKFPGVVKTQFSIKLKVNGKILEHPEGVTVENGNTITFMEGDTVDFIYKLDSTGNMYYMFLMLVLLIIILVGLFLLFKKKKKDGEEIEETTQEDDEESKQKMELENKDTLE